MPLLDAPMPGVLDEPDPGQPLASYAPTTTSAVDPAAHAEASSSALPDTAGQPPPLNSPAEPDYCLDDLIASAPTAATESAPGPALEHPPPETAPDTTPEMAPETSLETAPDVALETPPETAPEPVGCLLQQTTLTRGAFHQCGTARRVKVYQMVSGAWADLGTGYCAGVYDEQNDRALLVAKHEAACSAFPITPVSASVSQPHALAASASASVPEPGNTYENAHENARPDTPEARTLPHVPDTAYTEAALPSANVSEADAVEQQPDHDHPSYPSSSVEGVDNNPSVLSPPPAAAPAEEEEEDDVAPLQESVQPTPVQPGTPEDCENQYIIVVSEEFHQDDILLFSTLLKEDVYKQQQETLIVWTEPSGQEMALSFQERSGCRAIWDFLVEVQKHIQSADADTLDSPSSPSRLEPLGGESGSSTHELMLLMERVVELPGLADFSNHNLLPPPSLNHDTLFHLDQLLQHISNRIVSFGNGNGDDLDSGLGMLNLQFGDQAAVRVGTDGGFGPLRQGVSIGHLFHQRLVDSLIQSRYITALIHVFDQAEAQELLPELHLLCSITQHLLLLGDEALCLFVVQDHLFPGVLGLLEYDPAFPRSKGNFRHYMATSAQFKEVVPISDPDVRNKIQQTYRLTFLRDVVLARILPDSLGARLQSSIYVWQVEIARWCLSDADFLPEIFRLFSSLSASTAAAGPRRRVDAHSTFASTSTSTPPSTSTSFSTLQQKRADAVLFLQALCNIGKTIQLGHRVHLCAQLVQYGLLDVITFGLGMGLPRPSSSPPPSPPSKQRESASHSISQRAEESTPEKVTRAPSRLTPSSPSSSSTAPPGPASDSSSTLPGSGPAAGPAPAPGSVHPRTSVTTLSPTISPQLSAEQLAKAQRDQQGCSSSLSSPSSSSSSSSPPSSPSLSSLEAADISPETQVEVRNAAADMLLLLLDLDPQAVRQYIVHRRYMCSLALAAQARSAATATASEGGEPRWGHTGKVKHTYGKQRNATPLPSPSEHAMLQACPNDTRSCGPWDGGVGEDDTAAAAAPETAVTTEVSVTLEPPQGDDLIEVICRLLQTGRGLGVKSQTSDMLRALLNPASDSMTGPLTCGPDAGLGLGSGFGLSKGELDLHPRETSLLTLFYQDDASTLFAPLLHLPPLKVLRFLSPPYRENEGGGGGPNFLPPYDGERPMNPGTGLGSDIFHCSAGERSIVYHSLGTWPLESSVLFTYLCDLLTYLLTSHGERAEHFFMGANLGEHVSALLCSKDRPLVAAAMRVLKTCVARDNKLLHQYLLECDALGAMLWALELDLASGRKGVVTSTAISLFYRLVTEDRLRAMASSVVDRYPGSVEKLAQDAQVGGTFADLAELAQQRTLQQTQGSAYRPHQHRFSSPSLSPPKSTTSRSGTADTEGGLTHLLPRRRRSISTTRVRTAFPLAPASRPSRSARPRIHFEGDRENAQGQESLKMAGANEEIKNGEEDLDMFDLSDDEGSPPLPFSPRSKKRKRLITSSTTQVQAKIRRGQGHARSPSQSSSPKNWTSTQASPDAVTACEVRPEAESTTGDEAHHVSPRARGTSLVPYDGDEEDEDDFSVTTRDLSANPTKSSDTNTRPLSSTFSKVFGSAEWPQQEEKQEAQDDHASDNVDPSLPGTRNLHRPNVMARSQSRSRKGYGESKESTPTTIIPAVPAETVNAHRPEDLHEKVSSDRPQRSCSPSTTGSALDISSETGISVAVSGMRDGQDVPEWWTKELQHTL